MRLFHYTDVSAVKSILENGKLWLTDLRFMNDSEEMSHGVNYIRESIKSDWVQERLSGAKISEAIEFVGLALDDHVDGYMDFNPMFVCSFSQADDLLSQWRAYGSYSIEFAGEELEGSISECTYDPGVKSAIVEEATIEVVNEISRHLVSSSDGFSPAAHHEYLNLIKLAATFKHESFEEEKEFRMILEKMDCDFPFRFRARNGILIPYVEVPVSLKSIVSVKVGPMRDQELAYKSMCMSVDEVMRLAEYKGIRGDGIKVEKSAAPFRSV